MLNEATVSHDPMAVVRRLQEATNRHDLDALVGCFADDYLSEIPVHPSRTFRGREQVRRNWAEILAGVPDLRSELVRSATNGTEVWAEWEWTGTRRDGAPHLMRGTTVLNVEGDEIAWARFYMEPVVDDGATVEASVRQSVTPANAPEVGPEPGNEPGPTR